MYAILNSLTIFDNQQVVMHANDQVCPVETI